MNPLNPKYWFINKIGILMAPRSKTLGITLLNLELIITGVLALIKGSIHILPKIHFHVGHLDFKFKKLWKNKRYPANPKIKTIASFNNPGADLTLKDVCNK